LAGNPEDDMLGDLFVFVEMFKQDLAKGREHDPPLGWKFLLLLFLVSACLGLYFWLRP
jgi:hypothetical protein